MEAVAAENVFSEELWCIILDNLASKGSNLAEIRPTCKLFQRLSEDYADTWIRPPVFPKLLKFLSNADILVLRLVCKSWNHFIDNFLEEERYQFYLRGRNVSGLFRAIKAPHLVCGPEPDSHLNRFYADFKNSSDKNPFVSRRLIMVIRSVCPNVLRLFEAFGVHLFFLELRFLHDFFQTDASPTQIAEYIWKILSMVPNLQTLYLLGSIQQPIIPFLEISPQLVDEQALANLQVSIKANSLSEIPRLKCAKISFPLIVPIEQALQSKYAFDVVSYANEGFTANTQHPTELNKLKYLNWEFQTFSANKANCLQIFKSLQCPCLVELTVFLDTEVNPCDVICLPLFSKYIEKFKATLKYLSIRTEFLTPLCFPTIVDLPQLAHFQLNIVSIRNRPSIDLSFLHNCNQLLQLSFQIKKRPLVDQRVVEMRPEICQERKCEHWTESEVDQEKILADDLIAEPVDKSVAYKSSIWKLVPTLKDCTLSLSTEVGYRRWNNKKNVFSRKEYFDKYMDVF